MVRAVQVILTETQKTNKNISVTLVYESTWLLVTSSPFFFWLTSTLRLIFRKGHSPSGCSWWWHRWRHQTQTARSWCQWRRWSGCRFPWCPSSCSDPQIWSGCKSGPPRTCWGLRKVSGELNQCGKEVKSFCW